VDAPSTAPPTDWVPVDSCTLPTTQQPVRVAEFDDLVAHDIEVPAARSDVLAALVQRARLAAP
jgi:hypothetical protein